MFGGGSSAPSVNRKPPFAGEGRFAKPVPTGPKGPLIKAEAAKVAPQAPPTAMDTPARPRPPRSVATGGLLTGEQQPQNLGGL